MFFFAMILKKRKVFLKASLLEKCYQFYEDVSSYREKNKKQEEYWWGVSKSRLMKSLCVYNAFNNFFKPSLSQILFTTPYSLLFFVLLWNVFAK